MRKLGKDKDKSIRFIKRTVKKIDPAYKVLVEDFRNYDDEQPFWNGQTLRLDSGTSAGLMLHDLAHLIVASPKRRKEWEFGLGMDGNRGVFTSRSVTAKYAEQEERRACLLNWALAAYLFGVAAAYDVMDELSSTIPNMHDISVMHQHVNSGVLPKYFMTKVLSKYAYVSEGYLF